MLFLFYLVTTCFAVPIEKVHQVLGAKHVPTVDKELLMKIKSSNNNDISKLLIASLADADPDSVRHVKGLVEALIAAGEAERDEYTQDRDAKQTIYDTASTQLAADTTAHTNVAGQLSNARDEVTRLEGLKSDGETAQNEAKKAFDDAVTDLNDAEGFLADETTRVDTEKATLEEIRRLLNTLLPAEQPSDISFSQPSDYPGFGCMRMNNDVIHIPGELSVCQEACVQDTQCMSIDWYKPYPGDTVAGKCTNGETCCSLSYTTKAISGASWTNTPSCNYYEIDRGQASVGTVHDDKIFLANGHYIKCFGGASLSSTTLSCEYPLFDAEDYSLNKLENKYLGLYHEHNNYGAGHSWVNTYIGSLFFSNSVTTVIQNGQRYDRMWHGTGTDDTEMCYADGEVLKWESSKTCNPNEWHNGSNVMSEFHITGDPL